MRPVASAPPRSRPDGESFDALAARCAACLDSLYSAVQPTSNATPARAYSACVSYIIRMLAILIAAERIPPDRSPHKAIQRAARAVNDGDDAYTYDKACASARKSSGLGIFAKPRQVRFGPEAFAITARTLTRPHPDAPIERIYFETMPISWLGSAYQALLAFHPDETGDKLESNKSYRKKRGVFFTPPSLVSYVVEGVLTPIIESRPRMIHDAPPRITILDPAMGGGDFLTRVIETPSPRRGGLGRGPSLPTAEPTDDRVPSIPYSLLPVPYSAVYGVDVDPRAVEIARFGVWASASFADGITDSLNAHLICANALGARHAGEPPFGWAEAFPEVFAEGGFDAVIGNPPYIAAKNGLQSASAGQSDSYLLFLSEIMESNLVKPGGLLSMVLPDPMLVRENAAAVRRKIATEWSIVSLLHISEAFPDALVANVVPILRNAPPTDRLPRIPNRARGRPS